MNGEQFRECLLTVCKTTGYSRREIANLIGINKNTLRKWQRKGVPIAHKPYAMDKLKQIVREQ